MLKQEFDKMSEAAGFVPCADYMWPEIEKVYTTIYEQAGDNCKELVVYIYWYEPGIHREILALRNAIEHAVSRMNYAVREYNFPLVPRVVAEVGRHFDKLAEMIAEAKRRQELLRKVFVD